MDLINNDFELQELYEFYTQIKSELDHQTASNKSTPKKTRNSVDEFLKHRDHFRKLVKRIKFLNMKETNQNSKNEIKEILDKAIQLGVFPNGHPDLNDFSMDLNQEISERSKELQPDSINQEVQFYGRDEDPWTEEDQKYIKVLKL